MKKHVVTSFFAAMIFAISTCATYSQSCSPCGSANIPTYGQFCQQSGFDSCAGGGIFSDKMVRPFHCGLSVCCDPCFGGGMGGCCGVGFGGCLGGLGGLFGQGTQCAGPDFGYVYKPGYGANGQGLTPRSAWGYGANRQQGNYPSYTYRSPRDYLNPNPPSIGY